MKIVSLSHPIECLIQYTIIFFVCFIISENMWYKMYYSADIEWKSYCELWIECNYFLIQKLFTLYFPLNATLFSIDFIKLKLNYYFFTIHQLYTNSRHCSVWAPSGWAPIGYRPVSEWEMSIKQEERGKGFGTRILLVWMYVRQYSREFICIFSVKFFGVFLWEWMP